MEEIAEILLKWYQKHHRDLPWRSTKDPYLIWLSEVILQQTRVDQGLPYFMRFTDRFPTVHDLARADEDDVLKLWQGLGYYTRARNLHKAAGYISGELDGKFPDTLDELRQLPGIGDYTAAAIGSFAFGIPEPVTDGNVKRVICRLFGIDQPPDSPAGKKEIRTALEAIFDRKRPALFNQAIMEFGALQCVPRNPECGECPLQWKCTAYSQDAVDQLPVPKNRNPVRTRYLNFYIPIHRNNTFLEKRTESGIWRNLYQFPLYESSHTGGWAEGSDGLTEALGIPVNSKEGIKILHEDFRTHLLSHQALRIRFVTLGLPYPITPDTDRFIKVPLNGILSNFAVPRIIEKFVIDAGWE